MSMNIKIYQVIAFKSHMNRDMRENHRSTTLEIRIVTRLRIRVVAMVEIRVGTGLRIIGGAALGIRVIFRRRKLFPCGENFSEVRETEINSGSTH